ncbi:hypothetical protein BH11MYX1_BH11MYX1_09810 [soil metagenome]
MVIHESVEERAYAATATDTLEIRAQEMRRARPNLRLDVLAQLMVDHDVDWVLLDQHVIVTRLELDGRIIARDAIEAR